VSANLPEGSFETWLCIRLKQLRAETGESLQEVADGCGASKAHIWELEQGKHRNPGLQLLRALSHHFNVPVAYIIGETQYRKIRP
jgi:transcriptional regulator with XRE-family HTH domain